MKTIAHSYANVIVNRLESIRAEEVFDVCRSHDMVPDQADLAIGMIQTLTASRDIFRVRTEDDDLVALVFVNDVFQGDSAYVSIVLVPQMYGNGTSESVENALRGICEAVMDTYSLRRITSTIPIKRSRTKRLLRGAGFEIEGRLRCAWKARGRGPEDVYVMGLLAPSEE